MSFYKETFKTLSLNDLIAMKNNGEKISCLTAYDASFASLIDSLGIDIILVGDSLGMVIQGHHTTIPVLVEDMVYHSRNVASVCKRSFIITDMPFASYATPEQALITAAKLIQSGLANMVKLESAKTEIIRFLVNQGIPVCGHLGLLPQSVYIESDYRVKGKNTEEAESILQQAIQIEQAGAQVLVLECVPASLAAEISKRLIIPVIGIGAGVACDGQVLVLYDMLGISIGKRPRFSKNFLDGAKSIEDAIYLYHQAVKTKQFPDIEHSY